MELGKQYLKIKIETNEPPVRKISIKFDRKQLKAIIAEMDKTDREIQYDKDQGYSSWRTDSDFFTKEKKQ